MPRQLRSDRKELPLFEMDGYSLQDEIHELIHFTGSTSARAEPAIVRSQSRLLGLNGSDLHILRTKQNRLRKSAFQTAEAALNMRCHAARALASTLIFAQHEAGTAYV
ncbi:hypothetical protein N7463_007213 [Penicillium fimorum]|uniref:Uncharacterized protein n=1 Tax=Penicillium fimorum TaxID=1882269 RepID=A0A9W9XVV9_9EURO|nr:hypothetical protein N7463_007213 [Penicillium fimorum]